MNQQITQGKETQLELIIAAFNSNLSDYSSISDSLYFKICKLQGLPESKGNENIELEPENIISKLNAANQRFARLNGFLSSLNEHTSTLI